MNNRISLAALALLFAACQPQTTSDNGKAEEESMASMPTPSPTVPMVAPLQNAHGYGQMMGIPAVAGDLQLVQGGNPGLTGKMYVSGDGSRVRMELADSSVLVYDGTECWASTEEAATTSSRFHLLTWSYFLMAPYKLTDPGTHLEETGTRPNLAGQASPTYRLTFDSGIGDSPEDWYVVYQNAETQLMEAMAYIVTFSTPSEEAEPHAIHYQNYVEVAGVQLPTFWSLYNWSEESGFEDALGVDIHFKSPHVVNNTEGLFEKPKGAIRLPLPGDA
ncbi:MAG: hypothetical protein AAFQ98_07885 [Bacteroidota bacterium]